MGNHKGFVPWNKVVDFEVTEGGRVLLTSYFGGETREAKQSPGRNNYLRVRFTINGSRHILYVHRLVAAKFLPPRPSPQHEIRHLDGQKTNNCASNLAWGTKKENAEDRERHGRTSRGEKHGLAVSIGMRKGTNHDTL